MSLRSLPVRLAILALVVLAVASQIRLHTARQAEARLQERVAGARLAAEECTRSLAVAEAAFEQLDQSVDSLRSISSAFEALDADGVPAAVYDDYLGSVDRYNAAVAEWEAEADSLQSAERRCRTTVAAYNTLVDSVRAAY